MSIFVGPSADYWARIVGEENTAAYEDTEQFDLWVNARLTHPWIEKLSKHGGKSLTIVPPSRLHKDTTYKFEKKKYYELEISFFENKCSFILVQRKGGSTWREFAMEDGNNTYSYDGYEFDRYARHKTSSGSRNDPYLNIWDKDKDLADIAKDMFIFVGKKE